MPKNQTKKTWRRKFKNKFVEGETSRKWSAGAGKRYKLANSVSFLFIFCFFSCIFYFLFCAQSLEGNSNGGNLRTGCTFFVRLASVFFPSIFLIQKQEVTAAPLEQQKQVQKQIPMKNCGRDDTLILRRAPRSEITDGAYDSAPHPSPAGGAASTPPAPSFCQTVARKGCSP